MSSCKAYKKINGSTPRMEWNGISYDSADIAADLIDDLFLHSIGLPLFVWTVKSKWLYRYRMRRQGNVTSTVARGYLELNRRNGL